jgi:hypothetical protein
MPALAVTQDWRDRMGSEDTHTTWWRAASGGGERSNRGVLRYNFFFLRTFGSFGRQHAHIGLPSTSSPPHTGTAVASLRTAPSLWAASPQSRIRAHQPERHNCSLGQTDRFRPG